MKFQLLSCFFTLAIILSSLLALLSELYFPEYHPGPLHNVVQEMNVATWCRHLSLTFYQALKTHMQIQRRRQTSVSDPTCHSSYSRPASSLSSPAWWSLRSWARRRNSAVACPFQPRSAQSRSGWSAPCASYHCSRHTPGSPLRRDCTLDRWTEGLSQLTSQWIQKEAEETWTYSVVQHPRVRASYHHAGMRPSLGGLHSKKAEPTGSKNVTQL